MEQMKNIRPPMCSAWTPEREARAVRLYLREGFTASEVADALGGLSRAAVTGKMRRLGLLKRDRPPSAASCDRGETLRPRVESRLPPQRPPVPLPPLREVGPTGAPRQLRCLPDGACRWPIDDPGSGRMHLALFCGGRATHGAYCAEHRALSGGGRKSRTKRGAE
jgi:GcrA cell cycle regulator